MTRRRQATTTALALLVAASVALGCRRADDDDDTTPATDDDRSVVEDGADSASAENDAQLLTASLVSSAPGALGLASTPLAGGELGARGLGDGARAIYFPRGCLEVTDDAATKTARYTFDRCLGPNGLRAVSGVVAVSYRLEDARLHLELTASGLSVNRATFDWTATADITTSGANRTMAWKAELSGATPRGRTFRRTTEHTIAWALGEPCIAVDGTSEGEVGARALRVQIEDLRRCRRACPDPGGRIIVTNVTNDARYELRYDGTNQATLIGPRGNEVAVPLACAAQ